ncbi:hypothetical protein CPB85DRAFT_1266194 [Mucidula mucida]|nr:hypothetical protein CPB85DRAFT_1266194 [Mucidula mucida]
MNQKRGLNQIIALALPQRTPHLQETSSTPLETPVQDINTSSSSSKEDLPDNESSKTLKKTSTFYSAVSFAPLRRPLQQCCPSLRIVQDERCHIGKLLEMSLVFLCRPSLAQFIGEAYPHICV